jgi:putative phosphoserine phosphatase/1-acylglycerol-3-phosphate O-acyltransferase
VALSYEDIHADTASIMAAIVDLLPDEARQRHEPTVEELAKTLPPGKKAGTTRPRPDAPGG